LSLVRGLDPQRHLAIGRALSTLRDEGVLILGSGLSYHNMHGFRDPRMAAAPSAAFDEWLGQAVVDPRTREARLTEWARAPFARECHPREEHLAPLFVAAGAASGPGGDEPGQVVFRDQVMGVTVSALRFG
jgi:aromatic ring-opening dioxygenase catalytic subunit (LigB family)